MLYVSFLALHLSLLPLWPNVVRSTNVTDDGLAFLPLCIDRHSSRHRVCDPHNLLSEQSRHLLQLALVAGMSRTVCFCGAPCSADTTLSSRRLVIGALFLKELPT
ncbi:unnamed protein product [Dicrocoelium dendriticum]|nr:unnamed protein product [Dicrocoelium dendriticum]